MALVDQGAGAPLVLVHGFPLDHSMWSEQIAVLCGRCRVLAPDLRGFGRSAVTDGKVTMEQFADDLAATLDALEVTEPITLCGLSMGGYVVFEFWRKYGDRLAGVILCDTRAAADTPEAAAVRRETAERVLREGPAPLVETMVPKLLAESTRNGRPEVVEAIRRMILETDPRGIAAASLGMAERIDFTGELDKITIPTLVLAGELDVISTPEEMVGICRAIPHGRFVEIPGAGHMTPMENPAEVNEVIVEFLATM